MAPWAQLKRCTVAYESSYDEIINPVLLIFGSASYGFYFNDTTILRCDIDFQWTSVSTKQTY